MYLLNKQFWIASTERAIKTFVQALIAAFGVGQVSGAVGFDVAAIDWRGALSLAFSAALLSVLMSVGSGPIGAANSPSLIAAPAAAAPAAAAPAPAAAPAAPAAVVAAAVPAAAALSVADTAAAAAANPSDPLAAPVAAVVEAVASVVSVTDPATEPPAASAPAAA